MSYKKQFLKEIKESEKFARKIQEDMNAELQQKLKIEGIASITFSKEVGFIDNAEYRRNVIRRFFIDNLKIQFYIGKKRYGSRNRLYLYAWTPEKKNELGWGHFRFNPALTDKSLEILEIPKNLI